VLDGRSHLFSHVIGCVIVWCEVFAHGSLAGQEAGLTFFHMLVVVWWFGVRCLHLPQAAGLIFFHMLLVLWWFGVRCLHIRVISCAFRVISRQLLPGSRGQSAGSVPGITLCPRITLHS
jgi:hypothetical protein